MEEIEDIDRYIDRRLRGEKSISNINGGSGGFSDDEILDKTLGFKLVESSMFSEFEG